MQGSFKMFQMGRILISGLQATSDILTTKVTAFCTCPKNLPKIEKFLLDSLHNMVIGNLMLIYLENEKVRQREIQNIHIEEKRSKRKCNVGINPCVQEDKNV